MQCPICRTALDQTSVKGSLQPVCHGCSGVWFEEEQFLRFLDVTKKYRQESLDGYEPPVREGPSMEEGFCPHCNVLMVEHMVDKAGPYAGSYLGCNACKGVFIRQPELTLVEYLYCHGSWPSKLDRLSEVMSAERETRENEPIGQGSLVKGLLDLVDVNNPLKRFPWMTSVIITATMLLAILSYFYQKIPSNFALVPKGLLTRPSHGIAAVFTSMFAHADLVHAAGNMYFLLIFGSNLEDLLGRIRYAVLYVFFGFVSAVVYSTVTSYPATPLLGASGAVSGMLGGYLCLYPKTRVSIYPIFCFRLTYRFKLPAWIFLGVYFAGMQVLGIVLEVQGIAWWAHLAGFVIGYATLFVLKKTDLL